MVHHYSEFSAWCFFMVNLIKSKCYGHLCVCRLSTCTFCLFFFSFILFFYYFILFPLSLLFPKIDFHRTETTPIAYKWLIIVSVRCRRRYCRRLRFLFIECALFKLLSISDSDRAHTFFKDVYHDDGFHYWFQFLQLIQFYWLLSIK